MRLGRERPRKLKPPTSTALLPASPSMRLGRERPRKGAVPGKQLRAELAFNEAGARTPQKEIELLRVGLAALEPSMRLGRERPRKGAFGWGASASARPLQ